MTKLLISLQTAIESFIDAIERAVMVQPTLQPVRIRKEAPKRRRHL